MIATYEKDFSNKWNLVVYHDGLPSKSVNGQGKERYGAFEVPDNCIDVVGKDKTPNFGRISQVFQAPN